MNKILQFERVLQALRAEADFDERKFVGFFIGAVLAMLTDFQFEQAIKTAHQMRAQENREEKNR